MSEALRFELLGPQRAWYAGRPLDLGPAKQRAVLAVLLLAAGRPVPTGQIVEAVWPDEAPVNGLNVVQKHVAGLRRMLEPDRSPRTPARVLTLTDAGYLLRVPPEAVDVARFERGVQRARAAQAAGRTEEALAEVSAALELWQGEPFTGFGGTYFETARHRLVEMRAVALETRTELQLAGGRHGELVGRLVELVAEFPVRERLRHQLMLALHRSGRQAEALAAYRDYAGLLRDEYGIEPGGALQDLHRRILRADSDLLLPTVEPGLHGVPTARTGPPPLPVPPPVPAQPPTPVQPPVPVQPSAAVRPEHAAPADRAGPVVAPAWGPPPPPPAAPPAATPPGRVPGWLSVGATVASVLTALLSLGLLTWVVVLVYGIWRRSLATILAAVYYLGVAVGFVVVFSVEQEPDEFSGPEDAIAFVWLFSWLIGVLHVVLLNGRLMAWLRGIRQHRPHVAGSRLRREHARYLLYHYPSARGELRIGRPDLPRAYDDGGLVDVNSVADRTILGLPGLNPAQAQHMVLDRRSHGPYTSMEELAARCLLPPPVTDPLRDVLLFLPPEPSPGPPVAPSSLVEMPDEPGSDGRPGARRGGAAAAGG
ncbi:MULTISPECIES: BTAD domain-containing putative transcriptional regulator [unclassified Micromonospora]|uniref:BTAD domain-containing putative transcriptional regulator n=1 Tax=unclassified Micromonospora TaxID=2617518 RepID=UPI001C229926|nr:MULTISPECIES: BTAD domain-containing putative transcriptional regulator [unclassified Micromonospora]MBU8857204.1 winged helix-turn-helix domain-containing protein [Micromonospora sp. WMMB482]MDM4782825.1 BTAD domain-containing putative transcriptional regulator [Micromonospora sp. b486]